MAKQKGKLTRPARLSVPAILAIGLGLVVFGYVVVRVFAAGPASLYFSPSSGSKNAGQSLAVQVYANTGGQSVNAVQIDFTYPASKLSYVSVDGTGSAFGIAASNTSGNGTVSFARGNISAVTGTVLVGTVNFTVLSSAGTATLAWLNSSAVVSATTNQNIVGTMTSAYFTVVVPSTPTPTPAPTHTPTPVPGTTHTPTPTPKSSTATHTPTPSATPTTVAAAGSSTPTPTSTPDTSGNETPASSATPAAGPLGGLADAASKLLGGRVTVLGASAAAIPVVLLVVVAGWLLWRRAHNSLTDTNPSHNPAFAPTSQGPTKVTGAPPTTAAPPQKTYMPSDNSGKSTSGGPSDPPQA
jgi:Cohesin domain